MKDSCHFFPCGALETLPLSLCSFQRHAPQHFSRTHPECSEGWHDRMLANIR